ncbi:uncharacterized protein LOC141630413 [Silene latifolia]|uniref:uncharacterized protein LOC141630413 n=1 Tax=Silene latifolia TaxID=37657 RepID=UPI003D783229
MVGYWALWEHRNKVIFDAREVDPFSVIGRVLDVVEEMEGGGFLRVHRWIGGSNNVAEVERKGWEIPQTDFVKINVDAGAKEGVRVSVGVVCRDDRGRVLWGLSMVQDLSWESHVAEASAVFEDDILCLCNSFSSVLWSYTSLVNNMVAHSLAHILPRVVGRLVWSDVLPPIVNNAVNFDYRLI